MKMGTTLFIVIKKSKKKIERKTVQFKSLTIKEWLTKIIIHLYLKI